MQTFLMGRASARILSTGWRCQRHRLDGEAEARRVRHGSEILALQSSAPAI